MMEKMKSVKTKSKIDSTKDDLAKNDIIKGVEMLLFRRSTDFGGSLLNIGKTNENEIVVAGEKRLYRRKTDIEHCKDLSDNELIEVIQTQNREAYLDLFRRYKKKLFLYIYQMTRDKDEAEDILQNVFTKTYKNIQNFDLSRKFSSWIYRIAHNEAVNYLKRKSKRYTVSWDDVKTSKDKLDTASNEQPLEDSWLQKEITEEIRGAIKKLPEQYQRILDMRYFQEYSYDQISKILDKPVNTVGTLINRAKKKLLEVVKDDVRK